MAARVADGVSSEESVLKTDSEWEWTDANMPASSIPFTSTGLDGSNMFNPTFMQPMQQMPVVFATPVMPLQGEDFKAFASGNYVGTSSAASASLHSSFENPGGRDARDITGGRSLLRTPAGKRRGKKQRLLIKSQSNRQQVTGISMREQNACVTIQRAWRQMHVIASRSSGLNTPNHEEMQTALHGFHIDHILQQNDEALRWIRRLPLLCGMAFVAIVLLLGGFVYSFWNVPFLWQHLEICKQDISKFQEDIIQFQEELKFREKQNIHLVANLDAKVMAIDRLRASRDSTLELVKKELAGRANEIDVVTQKWRDAEKRNLNTLHHGLQWMWMSEKNNKTATKLSEQLETLMNELTSLLRDKEVDKARLGWGFMFFLISQLGKKSDGGAAS